MYNVYIYIYFYELVRLFFKYLIFLFDRKNINFFMFRCCDRELRFNNCDFIKEFVDFVYVEDF